MEWTPETVARLYELHRQSVDSLRRDVVEANQSLGSANPEQTSLVCLTPDEFESILKAPGDRSEDVRLWVRRMIRGNEHEFPELQAAG